MQKPTRKALKIKTKKIKSTKERKIQKMLRIKKIEMMIV